MIRSKPKRRLADNVIVMQKGSIVAAGTPLRLKSKFGHGYRLTLNSSGEATGTRPPVNSAFLESFAAGQVIWRIADVEDLGRVVSWADQMEDETQLRHRRHGEGSSNQIEIQAWDISMPTLEDVLLEKQLF